MGIGISAGGDAAGAVVAIIEDIVEYGFVWNVPPKTPYVEPGPVTGPGETRYITGGHGDWKNMKTDKKIALQVPIVFPGQFDPLHAGTERIFNAQWRHAGQSPLPLISYGAEGENTYPIALGDTNYPYNGPGAYRGQLIFKFGESGTPQPVWNENCNKSMDDKGKLFLRINCPDDNLTENSGSLDVEVSYNGNKQTNGIVKVAANSGWHKTDLEREEGWAESWESIFQHGVFPDRRLAIPVPFVKDNNARWHPRNRWPGCGPEGVPPAMLTHYGYEFESIEGNTAYPYSGPGAHVGQLLYKFGEGGTVLPVLSGDYWKTLQDSGSLYLRMNDKIGRNGSEAIYVRVS